MRQHGFYTAHIPNIHFHYYKNTAISYHKPLVLLHGIRLGGIETWEPIVQQLQGWSDILVPDLPGAGALNPLNKTDHDFDLAILLQALKNLIDLQKWESFDLVGYSYGGFLSMMLAPLCRPNIAHHFLIESALLIDTVDNLSLAGDGLNNIAELMKSNPVAGNQYFSTLVSNNSSRNFSLKANIRPIHNPLGFANLLKILTEIYKAPKDEIWTVINAQPPVTTLLCEPTHEARYNMLTAIRKYHPWNIFYIRNANHGVVFSNPDIIAKALNSWNEIKNSTLQDIYL